MGRKHLILESTPRGTHFTWEERLRLQYYYCGSNGYSKITSPALLARIFNKSRRTIAREIKRGLVIHARSNPPFETEEYNAEHAQLDAEAKMGAKGPMPKSGRHHDLVALISHLILDCHYSPYAAICHLSHSNLWPEGVRICEKTLYNYIESGIFQQVSDISVLDLRRQVSRRLPKKKSTGFKKRNDRRYLQGRLFKDYRTYLSDHPEIFVTQMDTVYNNGSDGPFIQTFKFVRPGLLFALFHQEKTALSMKQGVDLLESILGPRLFRKYVHVLLTDRGAEFSNAEGMETSADGTRRTRVYYCDPMQSGQKGTLENKHIELRYILPKGTDLRKLGLTGQTELNLVLSHINSSPVEILGGKSPLELTEFMYHDLYEKLYAFGIRQIEKDHVILRPYLLKK